MVAVLKACGDNLTRENVMKEAANIHIQGGPLLLPGITISTSATDYAPIKQMQMMKFDGNTWKPVRRGDLGFGHVGPAEAECECWNWTTRWPARRRCRRSV